MDFIPTRILDENLEAYLEPGIRLAANEGGTSSSKTISIIQGIITIAETTDKPLTISVVSETLPHLKRGAIRDFKFLMGEDYDDSRYNKSDHIYQFPHATLEFFSADDSTKLRGGRRDILFINEANNVSRDAYRELDMRTRSFTFLDWNPVSEFWAHEDGLAKNTNSTRYIHSTYQDALAVLPQSVIDNIESYKDRDPNWWNIYGLGLLGKIEGLVYPAFKVIKELPAKFGQVIFGLDFGYSNDPTALTKHIIDGDNLYSQELIYETGLTNQDLARKFKEVGVEKGYDEIIADSAEPKSIQELCNEGYNVKPSIKGADSVEFGHQLVRQYNQHWTEDSTHCIKEQRNFRYIADKDGKLTSKTTHFFSHGMDSRRYPIVVASHSPEQLADMAGQNEKKKEADPDGSMVGIGSKQF